MHNYTKAQLIFRFYNFKLHDSRAFYICCCILPVHTSEHLFHVIADHMAKDGYLEAGYDIVAMDDCWLARDRDPNGRLEADPDRFPSGMKALGDYVCGLSENCYLVRCIKAQVSMVLERVFSVYSMFSYADFLHIMILLRWHV